MKKFFIIIFFFIGLINPSSSIASHIELNPCIKLSHCVIEEVNVDNINSPLEKVKGIIENTPRTLIVDQNGDYLRAEVTSRIMKYVDDLEISFLPKK